MTEASSVGDYNGGFTPAQMVVQPVFYNYTNKHQAASRESSEGTEVRACQLFIIDGHASVKFERPIL